MDNLKQQLEQLQQELRQKEVEVEAKTEVETQLQQINVQLSEKLAIFAVWSRFDVFVGTYRRSATKRRECTESGDGIEHIT